METLCLCCLCPKVPRAVRCSPVAPLQPVMRRPIPGRVTSDLPITLPSCLSGLALPAQVGGRGSSPRSLGRALVPGGARKGPLGSENSQESQNWEQQQQQETEGSGSGPSLPPWRATLSMAPNRMGWLRFCEGRGSTDGSSCFRSLLLALPVSWALPPLSSGSPKLANPSHNLPPLSPDLQVSSQVPLEATSSVKALEGLAPGDAIPTVQRRLPQAKGEEEAPQSLMLPDSSPCSPHSQGPNTSQKGCSPAPTHSLSSLQQIETWSLKHWPGLPGVGTAGWWEIGRKKLAWASLHASESL